MSRFHPLIPLLPLAALFPIACWVLTGVRSPLWFGIHQSLAIALFAGQAVLMALFLHVCASVGQVRKYVNSSNKQVDFVRMWRDRSLLVDATFSALLIVWVHLAISGVPMIAEHYRQTVTTWYDAALWGVEQPLFEAIRTSSLMRMPTLVWEVIYDAMWTYVTGVLVAHVIAKRDRAAVEMVAVAALMFYITQLIALLFPTAGPAAYRPEYFPYLNGSLSLNLQNILTSYPHGRIQQDGLLYGMVAMPSLHIGLTWLAGYYLITLSHRTWPAAVIWLFAIWCSTIILGWHYALDGVGGIIMASVSIALVKRFLSRRVRASATGWLGEREEEVR